MSPKSKPSYTTIRVLRETADWINSLKKGYDRYDDVLTRLRLLQADIYVDFILIDNEPPQLHTCLIQLGEDKESLYFFDGKEIKPYDIEKIKKQKAENKTR